MADKEKRIGDKFNGTKFKRLTKAQACVVLGTNNFKVLATYGEYDIYESIEYPGEYAMKRISRIEPVLPYSKIDTISTVAGIQSYIQMLKEEYNEK